MGLGGSQARLMALLAKSGLSADEDTYQYDVALSYAGENRKEARLIADFLIQYDLRVFYDEYVQAELWGKNLYEHLSNVYQQAKFYCVIFVSSHYAQKIWTNHERRSAQARALKDREEYILPIRLDDSEIPGLLDTVGYIDLRKTRIELVCELLLKKIIIKLKREVGASINGIYTAQEQIERNIRKSFRIYGVNSLDDMRTGLQELDKTLDQELDRINRLEEATEAEPNIEE